METTLKIPSRPAEIEAILSKYYNAKSGILS